MSTYLQPQQHSAFLSTVGIPSSRRIERACYEDLAFRLLTGNQQPDHSRICDFRLVHLDALAGLFVQVLRLCQKSGLVSLGNVALDGTKVKANASKNKAWGPLGFVDRSQGYARVSLGVETNCCS